MHELYVIDLVTECYEDKNVFSEKEIIAIGKKAAEVALGIFLMDFWEMLAYSLSSIKELEGLLLKEHKLSLTDYQLQLDVKHCLSLPFLVIKIQTTQLKSFPAGQSCQHQKKS